MTRSPAVPDKHANPPPATADHEQVQSVTRALSILSSFTGDDVFLTLAELARRTGMHKPTVLRLARTLAASRFLVQGTDGAWRLGPTAGWLGSRYQAQFDAHAVIEPLLRELADTTGESASFYVFEDNIRSCLLRVEGPRGIRNHVRSGELLPLERGSAGRVILAALGEQGRLYDRIRKDGFHVTRGERSPNAASVAVAVRGARGVVLGSVSISGPADRLTLASLRKTAPDVVRIAARLSFALSGLPPPTIRSTWHPA